MAEIIDITGDGQETCADAVISVFPDICPNYLDSITKEKDFNSEVVISHILDQLDDGKSYPRRAKANLKRKREPPSDETDDAAQLSKRFSSANHRQQCEDASALPTYCDTSRKILSECFPKMPCKQLYRLFDENGSSLFATYLAASNLLDDWDAGNKPFQLNKRARESDKFNDETIKSMMPAALPGQRQALEELIASRLVTRARRSQNEAEQQRLREEEENLELARAEGTVIDCGCCYSECAQNRMVYCNGDDPHLFCRDCAKHMAETQIGLSKHTLSCMSIDGCAAGFSVDQKQLFLDSKLVVALERIEQEEALRLAGIENLETCPFCPFAAEYPEVEINKEFRCQNPECEITSCRLCRRETHIPQTCQEAMRESGHSARRAIEEAMSAALIRKCNKCGTPFIKENGCNKMTCTRAGCHNVQCYVCHKSCTYNHFDDASRGGKSGNCPLFESVEKRHSDEVLAAEAKARQEVAQANPEVDAEFLDIMVSDRVKHDEDQRRQASDARHPPERGLNVARHVRLRHMMYGNILPNLAGIVNQLAGPHRQQENLPLAPPLPVMAPIPNMALGVYPGVPPVQRDVPLHRRAVGGQARQNPVPALPMVDPELMLPVMPPALPFVPGLAQQLQGQMRGQIGWQMGLPNPDMEAVRERAARNLQAARAAQAELAVRDMNARAVRDMNARAARAEQAAQARAELAAKAARGARARALARAALPVHHPNAARAPGIDQASQALQARNEILRRAALGRLGAAENPLRIGALAQMDMPLRGSRERPIQLGASPPGARRVLANGPPPVGTLLQFPAATPITGHARNNQNHARRLLNDGMAPGGGPLRLQRGHH
ncbi:hypothetical protein RB597_006878 [Gaeumannomyces tritici]